MIELTELIDTPGLCVRLRGQQWTASFGDLAGKLAPSSSQRRRRIVFDWTELDGWDDRRTFNRACRKWSSIAETIARAAIVHRPRWNQQAAVLAAVLRVQGVQVRSWSPDDRKAALRWLST